MFRQLFTLAYAFWDLFLCGEKSTHRIFSLPTIPFFPEWNEPLQLRFQAFNRKLYGIFETLPLCFLQKCLFSMFLPFIFSSLSFIHERRRMCVCVCVLFFLLIFLWHFRICFNVFIWSSGYPFAFSGSLSFSRNRESSMWKLWRGLSFALVRTKVTGRRKKWAAEKKAAAGDSMTVIIIVPEIM